MPNAAKKKKERKPGEPNDEKNAQQHASDEIEPEGPPALKVVESESVALNKDEDGGEPHAIEPQDKADGDEPKKEVPPDLVPVPKEDEETEASNDASGGGETVDDQSEEPEEAAASTGAEESTDLQNVSDSEDTPFDDEKTDQAIRDIVAKEGDEVLAAQDAAAAAKDTVVVRRKSGGFWRNKWFRSIVLLLVLSGIAAACVVPTSRYWLLNTAGVRSSASLTVVDSTTRLPLKGVDVTLGGKEGRTDSKGEVSFTDLKLGRTRLTIKQVGFGQIQQHIVIGWGSNPLGRFALEATGVQYVIEVRDYLSGQPLEGVEATNGTVTAVSDKDGKITLTLESTVVAEGSIALSKAGYRSEAISLNEDPEKPTKATMVIDRKAVFVSRVNGKYDLFKSDLDGQNRELLLAATGNENSNISLAVSPDGKRAAFISTRSGKRDSGGFLLSSLALIDIENGKTTTIAEAAQIQLIDWIGSRIIFQLGSSDSSSEDRYAVVSYDYANNTRLQLVSANKLQTVLSARGLIFYAPAADASEDGVGLFKIGIDGKGKERVIDEEVVSVLRSDHKTLSIQTAGGSWIRYDLANGDKTQISMPGSLVSRLYIDNEGRSKSLWISQGVLRMLDVAAGKDTDVATMSGLTYPVQWVGASAAIFRVSNATETADYVVSLNGGEPRKITDVTPTYGFVQAQ